MFSRINIFVALLGLGLSVSCATPLKGSWVKGEVQYRLKEPDERQWRRVSFTENDAAWEARNTSHVLASNATCREHGDPSLEVLTQHLLFGFTDRTLEGQQSMELDGREALHSVYEAKLDGVPVTIELVVLKKNGCVHDFTYISPQGHSEEYRPQFDELVASFQQVKR